MSIDIHTHTALPPGMSFLSCFSSSSRVPDDSDSQSGVIKQRQNCLESRRVEGQEMPVLTLAPCVGTQGVPAINQVGPPLADGRVALWRLSVRECRTGVRQSVANQAAGVWCFSPQTLLFVSLLRRVLVFASCIQGAVCSAGSVTKT